MNLAQRIYFGLGAYAVAFGSMRGYGLDLRNPHHREAGPGRKHGGK